MAPTPKSIVRVLIALSLLSIALPLSAFGAVADHNGTPNDHYCDSREGCCNSDAGCCPSTGCCDAATGCDDPCKGAPSWAGIGNVDAGGVTLQTQVGGVALDLPRGLVTLAVSTTGTLDVTVDHKCVKEYTLKATVQSRTGSTSFYSWTASPACVSGSDVYNVPIGMDVAHVTLDLVWFGCDGNNGRDHRDVEVADPPLPLSGLGVHLDEILA